MEGTWTTADLATLDAAIASGVVKVRFQDREVEYQTMKDLLLARTEVANFLSQNGGTPQKRMVRMYTTNGY